MKGLRSRLAIGVAAALLGALTAGYASYAYASTSSGQSIIKEPSISADRSAACR